MGAVHAPGGFGSSEDLEGGARPGTSERVYRGLLRLYPAAFRDRYRDEMVVLFGDQLRDARAGWGARGTAATWVRSLVDLAMNVVGEHLRRDQTMAQSLATFEPTRSMRWLGLLGLAGGTLLLVAFLTFDPFEERWANLIRLMTFALGGAGVAAAFYPRQALAAPAIALVSAAAVVLAGAFYVAWLVLANWVSSPFSGPFGYLNMLINVALWLSAALYGGAMLQIGVAWRGMSRWLGLLTRLGAFALLGSSVAWIGDDRFGWVDSAQYGELVSTIAMSGVFLNGLGWVLLGAVLVVGGRGRQTSGA